ncbi:hypothetical protein D7W09_08000 [bacterium D16-34]|nr:hypothetical protein D7W09_08000 [bacterium D16-34]
MLCTNIFTISPVQAAAATVPSRTPTTLPISAIEATTANATQLRSKPTFVYPKFQPVLVVIALTNASPEFMATFATTVHATPKAKMAMPRARRASEWT